MIIKKTRCLAVSITILFRNYLVSNTTLFTISLPSNFCQRIPNTFVPKVTYNIRT